jgi:hypothetical protein
MTKKNGTPLMTVSKLFGRCLTVTVGGEAFEVKVMGDRAVAAARREQLLAALVAGGAAEVVDAAKQ